MRILIVSQYFWPESFRINDLAEGLISRGHEVEVLTGIPNYPHGYVFQGYRSHIPTKEKYNGIVINRVPFVPRGNGGKLRLMMNYVSYVISACVLSSFMVQKNFDLIFVFEPSPITVCLPAIFLKKLYNRPVILWVQDLWPESLSATGAIQSKFILGLVEKMVRFIYSRCNSVLIQSRAFADRIKGLGVSDSKIRYYPNSAEDIYQQPATELNSSLKKLLPEGFIITFAGNIGAAQDFNTIINTAEILKIHKDIHFVILGEGRMMPWVKQEIIKRKLQNTIHILGRYPMEMMPQFFSKSDALLVTLRKEPIFELTIPSKIQSYLACGKPVIAGIEGEGAKIIKEADAGVTCSAENHVALSEAILSLYRMPRSKRDQLGANGKDYFSKHFDREILLTRLEEWMFQFKES